MDRESREEKISRLQAQAKNVRMGGKGTARRKKKTVHKTSVTDEKKLQQCLKKVGVNAIPGIEEVNMIKEDGKVLHFSNPKVQAALSSNTFTVSGAAEEKPIAEMLPSLIQHLVGNQQDMANLMKNYASSENASGGQGAIVSQNDDIPELLENFDEASKDEV